MDTKIEGRHAYKHMNSDSKLFSAYSKVRLAQNKFSFVILLIFINIFIYNHFSIGSSEMILKKRVAKHMVWEPKNVRLIQTNGSNGTRMPLEKVFGSPLKIFL